MESSDQDYEDDTGYLPMTTALQIPSAIGIGLLIILAVGGNVITIIAYVTDKRLHTVYDTYIFNLAITDLLIGCISMPFYSVYTLKEYVWVFGYHGCKAWLVVDFTVCLQTILLTLLLSVDRLLLISYGTQYSIKVTMKKSIMIITVSWFVAFSLYGPFIIGWDHVTGYSTVADMDCDVEFATNFEYTTTTATIEFVLPVTVLAAVNITIYKKIQKRLKISGTLRTSTIISHEKPRILTKSIKNDVTNNHDVHNGPSPTAKSTNLPKIRFDNYLSDPKQDITKTAQATNNTDVRKLNSRLRRDFRAARILAILVIVFLVCWAPYTITTIIISFCSDCVNQSAYEALNWLLWAKSAINPFLYALNSSRYRYNFKKIIIFWKRPTFVTHTDTTINTAV